MIRLSALLLDTLPKVVTEVKNSGYVSPITSIVSAIIYYMDLLGHVFGFVAIVAGANGAIMTVIKRRIEIKKLKRS